MRVELDQSAAQVNERDQVIKGLEVDARQLRNQLAEQRREAVASAEGLQQAYAKIALLEGQIRQYKEVSSERATRVAQPDDAQAYRKQKVRAIIERSRHREQEVQTVQEDFVSEYERALEEEAKKLRQ